MQLLDIKLLVHHVTRRLYNVNASIRIQNAGTHVQPTRRHFPDNMHFSISADITAYVAQIPAAVRVRCWERHLKGIWACLYVGAFKLHYWKKGQGFSPESPSVRPSVRLPKHRVTLRHTVNVIFVFSPFLPPKSALLLLSTVLINLFSVLLCSLSSP